MIRSATVPARQRGMALITAMLLLIIITILALSMFRSFGTQEHVAGNLREKERALHAAVAAQQYAEWWLLQPGNAAAGSTACGAQVLTVQPTVPAGQICNLPLEAQIGFDQVLQPGLWSTRTEYQPAGMTLAIGDATNPPFFALPAFYIADAGLAADAAGEAYQINAYGYGSAATTVAVIESFYEVQQGVVNRGGL